MEYKIRKRNTPITTLIKTFLNKKSGKVVKSRWELQDRFDYLDWKDQKKILMTFLYSGMKDRKWASFKLLSYWDKSFEPIMEELWQKYHERELAWPIIRYFPVEYIKQNMDSLGAGHNYQNICIRLYGVEGFEMDESKLDEVELLNVYIKTEQRLTKERLKEMLFTLVEKICLDEYEDWGLYYNCEINCGITSVTYSYLVKRFMSLLEKINETQIIEEFVDWNSRVIQDEVYNSKILNKDMFFDTNAIDFNLQITKVCYLKHINEYRAQAIRNAEEEREKQKEYLLEMLNEYPSVAKLFSVFGLDYEETVPF